MRPRALREEMEVGGGGGIAAEFLDEVLVACENESGGGIEAEKERRRVADNETGGVEVTLV